MGFEGEQKRDKDGDEEKSREIADMIKELRKQSSGERTNGEEENPPPHNEESERP